MVKKISLRLEDLVLYLWGKGNEENFNWRRGEKNVRCGMGKHYFPAV